MQLDSLKSILLKHGSQSRLCLLSSSEQLRHSLLQDCFQLRKSIYEDGALPLIKANVALHTMGLECGEYKEALRASGEVLRWYEAVYGETHPLYGIQ